MISRGFIKSSILYTLAGTLPMASAFILLPFYIHHLSTENLGALWIYLAFSMLVQIIVTFSFDTSIYVHFHEYKNDKHKLSSFIGSAFLFMVFLALVIGLILMITGEYLFQVVFRNPLISFYPYGLISVFTGAFQALFKVHNSLLQTRQRPDLFFRSNLLSFSLIAGFTIAGLQLYPNTLLGPIGGRLLAAVIAGGWSLFSMLREFGVRFDYALLRSSFSFNFYSFIYQLQQWMMNYFDRILISFFLPLSEVGIYGFLTSCLMVVEFVVSGLYSSFSPKVVSVIMDQKEKGSTLEVNRYYNALTAAALVLVTSGILVFPVVIEMFITRADYQLAIPYIPYAILIYCFKSMRLYFGIPYGILKYTKPLPVIYLVVAALKIIVLVLLIRDFGIYGVIISSLLSFWAEIVLLYYNGSNRFQFKFNVFKLIGVPVAVTGLIVLLEPLSSPGFSIYLHALYFIVCLILLVWAFRNEARLINPLKILRSR